MAWRCVRCDGRGSEWIEGRGVVRCRGCDGAGEIGEGLSPAGDRIVTKAIAMGAAIGEALDGPARFGRAFAAAAGVELRGEEEVSRLHPLVARELAALEGRWDLALEADRHEQGRREALLRSRVRLELAGLAVFASGAVRAVAIEPAIEPVRVRFLEARASRLLPAGAPSSVLGRVYLPNVARGYGVQPQRGIG